MRDLYKTLELCAAEDAMDFCSEFEGIKSILENSDRNVKPFKKLCFRSGNDAIINDLTRHLQDFFEEQQLVFADTKAPLPDSKQKFRKILLFFFANTDATYKYNLRDDPNIAHVFEICPLLPKFLTVALVWELQLDEFFYEALSYMPSWLAFQYFEAANESLKFINDPKKVLVIIEQLLRALLLNIEGSLQTPMDEVDQKIIFNKLYDQAIILLRRFNTPDASKLEKLKKRQLDRYWGYAVKHLLQMVSFAFDLYESKVKIKLDFDVNIYRIGKIFFKPHDTKKKKFIEAVKDEELRIVNALLGSLQNLVMTIKMDSFIEWAEVDLTPQLTLQQAVGEMAYGLRERIAANASFEHGVKAVLETIEIRPKALKDIAGEATIGEILRNLDEADSMPYEVVKVWFDELFKRGTAVLDNDECLEAIRDHIKLITPNNCMQIMECMSLKQSCMLIVEENDSDDETDEHEKLESLLLDSIKEFSNEVLLELIKLRFEKFGTALKTKNSNSKAFEQRVIEYLNKYTTNFDFHEFLLLYFEDPRYTWEKFFESACKIKEHLHNFCSTVQKTFPTSFYYVDKVVKDSVLSQVDRPIYFTELFTELYFLIYRAEHKSEFLASFINGHITSLLDNEDYESLMPIIKSLYLITKYHDGLNFDEFTIPMLAVVAFVLDLARWNLTNFCNVRVQLVSLCIDFIEETLQRLTPVATDKDRKWLTSKIKPSCKPLTQFYFQKIITSPENIKSLDKFLLVPEDTNEEMQIKFLRKFIVCCNSAEFLRLMENRRLQEHASTALLHISQDVTNTSNTNSLQNFRYCLTCYLGMVNSKIEPSNRNLKLLQTVLQLLNASPKEYYEEIFMEAECLLRQILTDCIGQNCGKSDLAELKSYIEEMPDCQAKIIFLKHKDFSDII